MGKIIFGSILFHFVPSFIPSQKILLELCSDAIKIDHNEFNQLAV